jgi:hypothetical protein
VAAPRRRRAKGAAVIALHDVARPPRAPGHGATAPRAAVLSAFRRSRGRVEVR